MSRCLLCQQLRNTVQLKSCQKCKRAVYCSKKCRKKDALHAAECQILADLKTEQEVSQFVENWLQEFLQTPAVQQQKYTESKVLSMNLKDNEVAVLFRPQVSFTQRSKNEMPAFIKSIPTDESMAIYRKSYTELYRNLLKTPRTVVVFECIVEVGSKEEKVEEEKEEKVEEEKVEEEKEEEKVEEKEEKKTKRHRIYLIRRSLIVS